MHTFQAFHSNPLPMSLRPHHPLIPIRCTLTSPTPPQAPPSFSKWATSQKIDLSNLSLATFDTSPHRGMSATVALSKGTPLLTVPQSVTLQTTSLSPPPSSIPSSIWRILPWYARLALLLLQAKADNSSSLQPWIKLLPTQFDTPFHWSEAQLSELQNKRMEQAVQQQRKQYRSLYEQLPSQVKQFSYTEFIWAIEVVRSRAFAGPAEVAPFRERIRLFAFIAVNTILWPALGALQWENAINGGLTALFALSMYDILTPRILRVVQGVQLQRYALTPGIDFLNHRSSVTGLAEVSYEYFRERFVVMAGEEYKKGDQVFISYGKQGNDSLLQYYGFVEENNPADTYAFGAEVEKLLGVKEGALVLGRNGFEDKVVKEVAKGMGRDEDAAMTTLYDLCRAESNAMPTSINEDLEMLKSCKDRRQELALRYRIQKKELLESAIQ